MPREINTNIMGKTKPAQINIGKACIHPLPGKYATTINIFDTCSVQKRFYCLRGLCKTDIIKIDRKFMVPGKSLF